MMDYIAIAKVSECNRVLNILFKKCCKLLNECEKINQTPAKLETEARNGKYGPDSGS